MLIYPYIQNNYFCECVSVCLTSRKKKRKEKQTEGEKVSNSTQSTGCHFAVSLIMLGKFGWECLQNNIHKVKGRSVQRSLVKLNIHIYSYTFSFFSPLVLCVCLRTIMCLCRLNKYLPACRRCMCMYVSVFTAGSDILTICEGLNNMQDAALPTVWLLTCSTAWSMLSGHIFR